MIVQVFDWSFCTLTFPSASQSPLKLMLQSDGLTAVEPSPSVSETAWRRPRRRTDRSSPPGRARRVVELRHIVDLDVEGVRRAVAADDLLHDRQPRLLRVCERAGHGRAGGDGDRTVRAVADCVPALILAGHRRRVPDGGAAGSLGHLVGAGLDLSAGHPRVAELERVGIGVRAADAERELRLVAARRNLVDDQLARRLPAVLEHPCRDASSQSAPGSG